MPRPPEGRAQNVQKQPMGGMGAWPALLGPALCSSSAPSQSGKTIRVSRTARVGGWQGTGQGSGWRRGLHWAPREGGKEAKPALPYNGNQFFPYSLSHFSSSISQMREVEARTEKRLALDSPENLGFRTLLEDTCGILIYKYQDRNLKRALLYICSPGVSQFLDNVAVRVPETRRAYPDPPRVGAINSVRSSKFEAGWLGSELDRVQWSEAAFDSTLNLQPLAKIS